MNSNKIEKEKPQLCYVNFALYSIFLLLHSIAYSIYLYDIRPIALGIIIFGMGCFGLWTYWFFLLKYYFPMLLMLFLSLLTSMYGIGIFLNYYGIDVIFNFYKEIGNFIVRVL